jgi:hypothetical protein
VERVHPGGRNHDGFGEHRGEPFGRAEVGRGDVLAVLRDVRFNLGRRRMAGDVLGRALDPDDIGTQRGLIQRQRHPRVRSDVAELVFSRLAVDEDRVVVLDEESHRHTVRLPARPDGGEPGDEVLVEPALSVLTQPGGQMGREFHDS